MKVGKELFTRCGPAIVEALQAMDFEVFLDLKFHDIPNTTAMAVKAAAELGVDGQRALLRRPADDGGLSRDPGRHVRPAPLLIGVTVLTSMEQDDLAGIGLDVAPQEQVLRLAGPPRRGWTDWCVRPRKPCR